MIWTHAASDGYLLTSKDTDFYQRSIAFGAPPKVIWLRVGNSPTSAIATLLRQRYVMVRRFCRLDNLCGVSVIARLAIGPFVARNGRRSNQAGSLDRISVAPMDRRSMPYLARRVPCMPASMICDRSVSI